MWLVHERAQRTLCRGCALRKHHLRCLLNLWIGVALEVTVNVVMIVAGQLDRRVRSRLRDRSVPGRRGVSRLGGRL